MICEKCGTNNEDGRMNCINCDAALPNVSSFGGESEHVATKEWIGYMCINLIPCVGPFIYLVMLFVWAFGDTPKKSLKSYAQAQLIFMAIIAGVVILLTIIAVLIGIGTNDFFSSNPYYY